MKYTGLCFRWIKKMKSSNLISVNLFSFLLSRNWPRIIYFSLSLFLFLRSDGKQTNKQKLEISVIILFKKHDRLLNVLFVFSRWMDGWIFFGWQKVRKFADWRHCCCVILTHLSPAVCWVHFTVCISSGKGYRCI